MAVWAASWINTKDCAAKMNMVKYRTAEYMVEMMQPDIGLHPSVAGESGS